MVAGSRPGTKRTTRPARRRRGRGGRSRTVKSAAPAATQTYVLIANTSNAAASVSVTLLFEDGTSAERTFAISANSRFNVDVAAEFPDVGGRRFGAIVESLGASPAQIVVERAMYSSAKGVVWSAGTNALATQLQ